MLTLSLLLVLPLACLSPEENGAQVYDVYCGLCHGDEGQGYAAPQANALASPEFLAAATDDFLVQATIWGRPGTKMSPWGEPAGGPLSEDDVADVVLHIRGWETLPAADVHGLEVSGDAGAGGELFAEQCAQCHGAAGEGASAMSLNNPEFLANASDGFLRHAIDLGRPGTAMAPYGGWMTPEQLDDLVVFIRAMEL